MARSTLAALIARVRLLTNDVAGVNQQFTDDDIQAVMDESREDVVNQALIPKPTFTGSTIQYLNYYSDVGGWEDDYVLKQYLTVTVTPSAVEPIAGHFQFAATTLPPIYITGKRFDVYRAAADLLERWAARYMTRFDFTSDSQSFRVSQVPVQMQALAKTYRMKQRPGAISTVRGDLNKAGQDAGIGLGPHEIDYIAKG